MPLLQIDETSRLEQNVVPGYLITQYTRSLERPKPFLGDRTVILMKILQRRNENKIRFQLITKTNEMLQYLLPVFRKIAHRISKQMPVRRPNAQCAQGAGPFLKENVPKISTVQLL
jgi:hypothetical protein